MRNLIAVCVLCVFLAGCGGGSSGPPIINFPGVASGTPVAPLAGKWSGSYSASNGEQGTMILTIGSDNRVVGELHSNTYGRNAVAVGNVAEGYFITTDYHWSPNVASPYSSEMFAVIPANGHLTGEWKQYYVSLGITGSGTTLNVDLARQ